MGAEGDKGSGVEEHVRVLCRNEGGGFAQGAGIDSEGEQRYHGWLCERAGNWSGGCSKDEYRFIDRYTAPDRQAAEREAYYADVYLASANAMTEDGVLVNIDGNSNRVSAIAYGPKKVIFIVSMNKICIDVDSAMKRARNVAAPINAQRFGLTTPCAKTGSCMNCKSPDTICCQFLITRYSKHPGRIHVILVNDALGF